MKSPVSMDKFLKRKEMSKDKSHSHDDRKREAKQICF